MNSLALPLVRRCQEQSTSYPKRIEKAVKTIEKELHVCVSYFVFGDLHLEHIKKWREDCLYVTENIQMEYPVWGVDYNVLMNDLEMSGVECEVSACPGPDANTMESTQNLVDVYPISVGNIFNRSAKERCERLGWDGFGEKGEFHTLAKVWLVSREKALGIES